MAYSQNFPAQRPVFQFNADAGRVSPNMTFSRSDSPIDATKAAASAVHYWSNEKHLSSENLLSYSSDISQSAWTKDGLSETGGQTAPDGGTDAYKLAENSATSYHRIYAALTADGGAITLSAYVKYIGRQWVYVRLNDSTTTRRAWFDVQNGATGTADSQFSSTTITASGNGYYKITATLPNSSTSSSFAVIASAGSDGSYSTFAGLNADAFAVWGIQVSSTGETVLNETSGQIHREYAPTLKSVATAGDARFEYDPTDGQSMGLLIEGQAQNLAAYSSDFSNAAWTKTRTSVEANAAIGPDGTLSASLIRDVASTSNTHHVYQLLPSIASGTVVTASVFAKAAGRTFLIIQNGSTTPYGGSVYKVWFNLTAGTVGTISGSGVTASATDCGNGWTRCTVTFPASTSTSAHALQINSSEGDNDEYHVGDDYSGVLLYGAQYEQSSFGSSYIGTTSSAVTRAADSLSVAMAGMYDGGPVTLTGEFETSPASTVSRIYAQVDDGAGNDKNRITMLENPTNFKVFVTSDGASQVAETSAASSGTFKKAVSLDTNDYASVLNGGAAITDTSATLPSIGSGSKLFVGCGPYSGNELNAHVKRVAVYSEALSDTNLQALTS